MKENQSIGNKVLASLQHALDYAKDVVTATERVRQERKEKEAQQEQPAE